LLLKGGLLPFPRTGCVLYARQSYHIAPKIRPREGMGRLRRVAGERYCTFVEKLADTVAGIRALPSGLRANWKEPHYFLFAHNTSGMKVRVA
jgi:hypothetical protein